MYPLIEIKTVPIEIEMKTTNATWEYRRGTAEMEIRREKGGLKINSRPIRVQMDTFEARNSVSPTPMRSVEQSAQRGRQAAYEATRLMLVTVNFVERQSGRRCGYSNCN